MSKRWLIALLLISFSFNLAVLGSFLYFRLAAPCPFNPTPDGNHRMIPPHDRRPFGDNDKDITELRKQFDNTKESLMQELSKDPVNEARVQEIIDSSLVTQNELERRLGSKILAYRKTMNAEEAREHFLRRAEHMRKRSRQIEQNRNRRKS